MKSCASGSSRSSLQLMPVRAETGFTTALWASFCQTASSTRGTTSALSPAALNISPMARTSSVITPSTGAIWMGLIPVR